MHARAERQVEVRRRQVREARPGDAARRRRRRRLARRLLASLDHLKSKLLKNYIRKLRQCANHEQVVEQYQRDRPQFATREHALNVGGVDLRDALTLCVQCVRLKN